MAPSTNGATVAGQLLRLPEAAVEPVEGGARQSRGSAPSLGTWLAFVKPHIDVTFVFVGVTGAVLAAAHGRSLPPLRVAGVVAAVALLSAGAECWTNLLDRDLDGLMTRTADRPLPSGRISVRAAAVLGAVLSSTGLAVAGLLGLFPFLFLGLALVNNVVVYSALTKRNTPWSIVLGAPVGSLTLWAGYAAVRAPLSPAAWLLGAMVSAWVPVHIWAIALRHRDDYARAGVPMAPVVWSRHRLATASSISALVMGALATRGVLAVGEGPVLLVALVAALSLVAVLGASLLPWRPHLAPAFIRFVTLYLLVVMVAAIGAAA